MTVLARPSVNLQGNDGYVSVTQSTDGTYKYQVVLKDSSKFEQRFPDGSVIGEFTAPNPQGHFQTYKYTSGPGGYQIVEPKFTIVHPTPVVPVVPPYAPARPVVVHYSPDVLAARQRFLGLFQNALVRNRRF